MDEVSAEELAQKESLRSVYIPPDVHSMNQQWSKGVKGGDSCYVDELSKVFAWKSGHINLWTGWANDGKGTFFDFMAVMKSKFGETKHCLFKQEDMSSHRDIHGKTHIDANNIYNNLIWTFTGVCPIKHVADKYHTVRGSVDQYMDALDWVEEHFCVVYTKDREYTNVLDIFRYMHEYKGCTSFLGDPWKSFTMGGKTIDTPTDLNNALMASKEFALEHDAYFNLIAHPRSVSDAKEKDGRFKVVSQYMVAGGAAWDNNMDAIYSIFRPERHNNPTDTRVHFHNLKQREGDLVGCDRGSYEDIRLDRQTRRYFFNQICPLDGDRYKTSFDRKMEAATGGYDAKTMQQPKETTSDELPF